MMNEAGALQGAILGKLTEQSTEGLYERLVIAVGNVRTMAVRLERVGDKILGPMPEGDAEVKEPQPDTYAAAVTNLESAVHLCEAALRRVENGL